jgi:hypothetical protein
MAGQSRTTARPAPQRAVETAPADPFDALDELARQEEAATPLQDVARCSQCATAMPPGAVVCTSCGYDTRTGKKLAIATAAKPSKASAIASGGKKGKAVVDRMAPTGSLAAGLVMSLIFAVAASLVWISLAYLTGVTIGYVAILIGGAAGVGMQIGHKGYSRAGGIAAAALTLGAILLAKVVVLELILSRVHKTMGNLTSAELGYYFLRPMGLVIIVIGMGAAFRTANGSVTD